MRYYVKLFILWVGSLLHRNRKSKILFYHDVFNTTNYKALDADTCMGTPIDLFKRHVDTIRKCGYSIVPKITKEKDEVSIMFDDGFRGIYECRQYFYDNCIRPTIFLPVAYLGKKGILTKSEIFELMEHGFNFQCHSWSHEDLTKWSDKELEKELGKSKKFLEKYLNSHVSEICLPLGYYSDHLLEVIKDYGYKEVYSSAPGNYYDVINAVMRPRILCQFASTLEVKLYLIGGGEIVKKRYLKLRKRNSCS